MQFDAKNSVAMFLTNFEDFSQITISHLPYKEISIKTPNTLGLDAIIVLLSGKKSAVLNIWYIKLHCKSISEL